MSPSRPCVCEAMSQHKNQLRQENWTREKKNLTDLSARSAETRVLLVFVNQKFEYVSSGQLRSWIRPGKMPRC